MKIQYKRKAVKCFFLTCCNTDKYKMHLSRYQDQHYCRDFVDLLNLNSVGFHLSTEQGSFCGNSKFNPLNEVNVVGI